MLFFFTILDIRLFDLSGNNQFITILADVRKFRRVGYLKFWKNIKIVKSKENDCVNQFKQVPNSSHSNLFNVVNITRDETSNTDIMNIPFTYDRIC